MNWFIRGFEFRLGWSAATSLGRTLARLHPAFEWMDGRPQWVKQRERTELRKGGF